MLCYYYYPCMVLDVTATPLRHEPWSPHVLNILPLRGTEVSQNFAQVKKLAGGNSKRLELPLHLTALNSLSHEPKLCW